MIADVLTELAISAFPIPRKRAKSSEIKSPPRLIAYDLETTRIGEGTPDLLYITAYGDGHILDDGFEVPFKMSARITGENKYIALCKLLETYLLIPEHDRAQFVAWNGNKFDAYFIVRALLTSDNWIVQPYMTASKSLRGMMVKTRRTSEQQKIYQYQFLDGISMTGIIGKKLKDFIGTFAPDFPKLALDFETDNFDCNNPEHIKYAERDSEGLYHAMKKVREIIFKLTESHLKPTIGNLAINYFIKNVSPGIALKRPKDDIIKLLHGQVKRGGYCWAARQYKGPVWKYDLNQAYAAALRDAELPSGNCIHTHGFDENMSGIYEVELNRDIKTTVPFYYKDEHNTGLFTDGSKKIRTWITSIEVKHLKSDNWRVNILSGFYFTQKFNMQLFVDSLETLRATDKDGPNGSLGTMVKMIGNHAYGKTLEQLFGLDFVFALTAPESYIRYDPFNPEAEFIYARSRIPFIKKYHQPQIGVFVTAHVRCLVRQAAIVESKHFLYADTDCLVFSKPVNHLEIHPTKYGAWKQEANGEQYIIIGKKVYHKENGLSTAKGLIVKNLDQQTYLDWLRGKIPVQLQTQRQNILKFLGGRDMFSLLERRGTNVAISKTVQCLNGYFIPM